MLAHGYQGVNELATRLENTFGWSATAAAVDGWVYEEAGNTFVRDEATFARLTQLNPRATTRLLQRLQEAAARGYWQPDAQMTRSLDESARRSEDAVEGVSRPA